MCRRMVNIQSPTAEIRRGKKKKKKKIEEERNYRMKILWSALLHRATIKNRDAQKKRTSHKAVESVLRPEGSLWWKRFVKKVGLEPGVKERGSYGL